MHIERTYWTARISALRIGNMCLDLICSFHIVAVMCRGSGKVRMNALFLDIGLEGRLSVRQFVPNMCERFAPAGLASPSPTSAGMMQA